MRSYNDLKSEDIDPLFRGSAKVLQHCSSPTFCRIVTSTGKTLIAGSCRIPMGRKMSIFSLEEGINYLIENWFGGPDHWPKSRFSHFCSFHTSSLMAEDYHSAHAYQTNSAGMEISVKNFEPWSSGTFISITSPGNVTSHENNYISHRWRECCTTTIRPVVLNPLK